MLAGCAGGGFGESVSIPRQSRQVITDDFGTVAKLALPADQPFNIVQTQRHSTGSATAESSSAASGTAGCAASAGSDGTAWSEFQLGHVLHHDGSKPRDVTVWFDVTYEYEVTASDGSSRDPEEAGLKVCIQDSDRRTLNKIMLLDNDDRQGPAQWSGHQKPSFDVTLEPGLAYNLVVAGRVAVAGTEGSGLVTARLDVKSLRIDVEPH